MGLIVYKGDHAGVIVPLSASQSIEAAWGEPVEVPDKIAGSLLSSGVWIRASKPGKKAAKEADVIVNDEKGATDGDR